MIVIKEQFQIVFRRRKCYFCSDARLPKEKFKYCMLTLLESLPLSCSILASFYPCFEWQNGICMSWLATVWFWLTRGRLSGFEINSSTGAEGLAGGRPGGLYRRTPPGRCGDSPAQVPLRFSFYTFRCCVISLTWNNLICWVFSPMLLMMWISQ